MIQAHVVEQAPDPSREVYHAVRGGYAFLLCRQGGFTDVLPLSAHLARVHESLQGELQPTIRVSLPSIALLYGFHTLIAVCYRVDHR